MSNAPAPRLPATFNRLAWSNLAAQSAEQIALAAAPIVAVLSLGVAEEGFTCFHHRHPSGSGRLDRTADLPVPDDLTGARPVADAERLVDPLARQVSVNPDWAAAIIIPAIAIGALASPEPAALNMPSIWLEHTSWACYL